MSDITLYLYVNLLNLFVKSGKFIALCVVIFFTASTFIISKRTVMCYIM